MEEITSDVTNTCGPSDNDSSEITKSYCESLNPVLEIRNCTAAGKWENGCPEWDEWTESGLCSKPEYNNGQRDGVQLVTRKCLAPNDIDVDNELCESLGPQAQNTSCGEDTSGHV